jgi:hypothetical protein
VKIEGEFKGVKAAITVEGGEKKVEVRGYHLIMYKIVVIVIVRERGMGIKYK